MRKITVNKQDLLQYLSDNRTKHEADFALAWDGFVKKANKEAVELLGRIDAAKPGEPLRLSINLTPPENHGSDYARVIAMCMWEVADEVTLDEQEFRQYVQDDWGWKQLFTASNMLYTGAESPSSR